MSGWGFGVRGKREPVPAGEQGLAAAEYDAAEEAADRAFAERWHTCYWHDGLGNYVGTEECEACKALSPPDGAA